MSRMIGSYRHQRNDENFDKYFEAIGVPYLVRKMMSMSRPRLDIAGDGDKWTIRSSSMMRVVELTFSLGEEYEETMPSGDVLKNTTTLEGDALVTVSRTADGTRIVRKYELEGDEIILTMTHEKSGLTAKRYFKRT